MIVLGLDPGTEQSALVAFDGVKVVAHGTEENAIILHQLHGFYEKPETVLVLEDIQSYGMAVGVETFRTVFWSGRFAQVWAEQDLAFHLLGRRDIKQHLCFSARATDANIRQALYDRFGPGKDKAVGKKKTPGPLYGVVGHEMAALAVAVTWWDKNAPGVSFKGVGDAGF